jgi:NAD(P)-dependent dehydrogenase (short-subunit alcohol dehydrogenase family)
MTDDFAGRTALITGASRGIGLAIASAILDGGGRVCLTARRADELQEAVAVLGANDRVTAVAGSADDPAHRAEAVGRTVACFGSLDILVNNAATNPVHGPLIDAPDAALAKIFDVNMIAPVAWVREVWSAWMADHGGSVVNVASISGIVFEPNLGAYGASKAALIHATRQLAVELSPRVRVNAIAPGIVKTRFARALFEEDEMGVADTYPLGRLGLPEDVAAAACFLLSDRAAWMTGQTLVLDGGITGASGALDRVDRLANREPNDHPLV